MFSFLGLKHEIFRFMVWMWFNERVKEPLEHLQSFSFTPLSFHTFINAFGEEKKKEKNIFPCACLPKNGKKNFFLSSSCCFVVKYKLNSKKENIRKNCINLKFNLLIQKLRKLFFFLLIPFLFFSLFFFWSEKWNFNKAISSHGFNPFLQLYLFNIFPLFPYHLPLLSSFSFSIHDTHCDGEIKLLRFHFFWHFFSFRQSALLAFCEN